MTVGLLIIFIDLNIFLFTQNDLQMTWYYMGPSIMRIYDNFLSETITNSLSRQTAKSITCEGGATFILGNKSKVGSGPGRRGLVREIGT